MLTSRLDAYISKYGDFCAHDDNDNSDDNDKTDYFTPCACARGNKEAMRRSSLLTVSESFFGEYPGLSIQAVVQRQRRDFVRSLKLLKVCLK